MTGRHLSKRCLYPYDCEFGIKYNYSHAIEAMCQKDKQILVDGFRALDRNSKGVLTRKDIHNYFCETGYNKEEAQLKTKHVMKIMHPNNHNNNSGVISLSDYVRAKTLGDLKAQLGSDTELNLKTLEMLDPQHTGKIDVKLLESQLVNSVGKRETIRVMKTIENDIDNNGNVDVSIVRNAATFRNGNFNDNRNIKINDMASLLKILDENSASLSKKIQKQKLNKKQKQKQKQKEKQNSCSLSKNGLQSKEIRGEHSISLVRVNEENDDNDNDRSISDNNESIGTFNMDVRLDAILSQLNNLECDTLTETCTYSDIASNHL